MKKYIFITITALMAVMVSSCKDNWSVELTAQYTSNKGDYRQFVIALAGTGTFTIDWGDGTVLKDIPMSELKAEYDDEDEDWLHGGKEYEHVYDKFGTYSVQVSGKDGSIALLYVYTAEDSDDINYTPRLF